MCGDCGVGGYIEPGYTSKHGHLYRKPKVKVETSSPGFRSEFESQNAAILILGSIEMVSVLSLHFGSRVVRRPFASIPFLALFVLSTEWIRTREKRSQSHADKYNANNLFWRA